MTRPIDIIANAILAADSGHPEPRALAEVAADSLTHEHIVAHAAEQLRLAGFGQYLSNGMLEHAARTVLQSVGEA